MQNQHDELAIPEHEPLHALDPEVVSSVELKRSFRRLVLLYKLGRQICSETDETRVFTTVLEAVRDLLRVERAFIGIVSGSCLVPRAQHGIELSNDSETWPISMTMLNRVLKESVSLLTSDALHDPRYGAARSVDKYSIRSVMCCPLRSPGGPRGLIYVDNRADSGAFSPSDVEFLSALSHFAVLAIANAEKLSSATAGKERAEALVHVLRDEQGGDLTIVGHSGKTAALYEQARRAAKKDVSVLLVGETGTGKEVFAKLIHSCSPRADHPFVPVNVGALPTTMVESELFGHEKGAFTGAEKRRLGRFELAHGGTLFLDEVLDIPLDVQPKLLRVLEQRTFERLGSNQALQSDARIICACNKDPAAAVAEGRLREDLYYRLNTVTLELPALRERRADIVPLIRHFLEHCGSAKEFDDEALGALASYHWPGNIRELRNCVEAIDAMVDGARVHRSDLPSRMGQTGGLRLRQDMCFRPLPELITQVEQEHFAKAMELANGNNERAMELLGISRAKFYQRKKDFGL